jgi:hypothetical protein
MLPTPSDPNATIPFQTDEEYFTVPPLDAIEDAELLATGLWDDVTEDDEDDEA